MIWSEQSDNPKDGFEIMPNGTLRARAGSGCFVMTLEECNECLRKRGMLWKIGIQKKDE